MSEHGASRVGNLSLERLHAESPDATVRRLDGAVKLVDLGIAQAAEQTRLTLTASVLGTASYMAPEQLEGGRVGRARAEAAGG